LYSSIMTTTTDAFAAIRNGDLDALTAALDAGTDPNASDGYGTTLLMHAVYWGQSHTVNLLLSRGADVYRKDHDGRTALSDATFGRHSNVFPAIFSAAGPRAMNSPNCHGSTPLHYLACYGSAKQMAFALSHPGLDISIRDEFGRTALDVSGKFLTALQTYGDQEARWQPMRCAWIELLMVRTPW
jgi:ankyrin repeat protein